jgi:F-type H+-transporting ATPase subunit O
MLRSSTVVVAGVGRRAASSLALKYSKAVFSAALSKSPQTLNKVQSELSSVSAALKQSPELDTFVKNPTLSEKDRSSGLSALYAKVEGTGAKKEPVSDITKNLFSLLSENGRLAETQGVIEGFEELVAKHKGELTVVVTSATPLPAPTLSRLETALKQSEAAQQSKSLKVTNKVIVTAYRLTWPIIVQVNPSILGGLVVDFGEKTIDLSVSSRVGKLNNLLQRESSHF